MRAFLSLLAVFALAAASAQAEVAVNDIVDTLLERLSASERITSLPDLEEEGEVKLLFWKTPVTIDADDGAPIGNVSLRRFSDAVLDIDFAGNLALTVEIGFEEAECHYEYNARLAKVKGPGGRFSAKIGTTTLTAKVSLSLSTSECRVSVASLVMSRLGDIELESGGSSLVNKVYNSLLVDMLKKKRYSALSSLIEAASASSGWDCNSVLPSFMAPSA